MVKQYSEAGVDIERGDDFVEQIAAAAKQTYRPEVLSGIGGFAAHFALDTTRYRDPILVSCTDGVGTKLKVAIECRQFDTIGTDLVAMCVNDLVCSGADPLFFLDYFATGKIRPPWHTKVIEGIAKACKQVGCALVGGETAEMPGMYHGDDFDLAGFAVGAVDRPHIIDGSRIAPGHTLIGVASTGFHSNGYSLLRKLCADHGIGWNSPLPGESTTVGEFLLRPTALYSRLVQALRTEGPLMGIAHITGGGLHGNVPRILPDACQAVIPWNAWALPPAFDYFATLGKLNAEELRTVFNCGIGMVLVVPTETVATVLASCQQHGHGARVIGIIRKRPTNEPAIVFTE